MKSYNGGNSSVHSYTKERITGQILCFTLWDTKTTVWDTYFTLWDTKSRTVKQRICKGV